MRKRRRKEDFEDFSPESDEDAAEIPEPREQDATDQRILQLEAQVGQLTQAINDIVNYLKTQQQAPAQPPPQPNPADAQHLMSQINQQEPFVQKLIMALLTRSQEAPPADTMADQALDRYLTILQRANQQLRTMMLENFRFVAQLMRMPGGKEILESIAKAGEGES
jgi:hypothetical protein